VLEQGSAMSPQLEQERGAHLPTTLENETRHGAVLERKEHA